MAIDTRTVNIDPPLQATQSTSPVSIGLGYSQAGKPTTIEAYVYTSDASATGTLRVEDASDPGVALLTKTFSSVAASVSVGTLASAEADRVLEYFLSVDNATYLATCEFLIETETSQAAPLVDSPFATENDALRREVRKGVQTTLSMHPKLAGENVQVASATWTLVTPTGNITHGPVSASIVAVGDYSRLDFVIPAQSTLDEDYRLDVEWTTTSGASRFSTLQFDVVLHPFGDPSVSLNSLLEERPDVQDRLQRMGLRLGFSPSNAAQRMAGVFAIRARVELDAMIRDSVAQDAGRLSPQPRTTQLAPLNRYSRPYLILNRERLDRVERKLAMRLLFAADMQGGPDSQEEASALYAHYDREVENAWRQVGPLKYDSAHDLQTDTTLADVGRSIRLQRVQG